MKQLFYEDWLGTSRNGDTVYMYMTSVFGIKAFIQDFDVYSFVNFPCVVLGLAGNCVHLLNFTFPRYFFFCDNSGQDTYSDDDHVGKKKKQVCQR